MRRWLFVPALLAAAVLHAALDRDSGIRTWLRLRAEVSESQLRIARAEREVAALRREADALENDPFALERVLREELGWAREGEAVVRSGSDSRSRFP